MDSIFSAAAGIVSRRWVGPWQNSNTEHWAFTPVINSVQTQNRDQVASLLQSYQGGEKRVSVTSTFHQGKAKNAEIRAEKALENTDNSNPHPGRDRITKGKTINSRERKWTQYYTNAPCFRRD